MGATLITGATGYIGAATLSTSSMRVLTSGSPDVTFDEHHTIVEIGGADVLSYREMMQRLGKTRRRVPVIVPVPVLTPSLSSLWCGPVTSVPVFDSKAADRGTRNETIVRDETASRLFPDLHPVGFDEAVTRTRSEAATA